MEKIMYPGPEGYTIKITYGALSLGSYAISSILIIKPLKEEDYYTADGNTRKKIEFTEHSLALTIGFMQLRQALGETITIKFTNMRETIGPRKELRFDTYTISTKDGHLMYTNITFDKYHVNTIDSADCETALLGAIPRAAAPPSSPSPNIEGKIAKIQGLLPDFKVTIAPGKLDTIQILNTKLDILAYVGKERMWYSDAFKGKFSKDQEREIKKILGLLEGGRQKPKRRTNRNKKRRRTHRV
jgi:hypothetical protein